MIDFEIIQRAKLGEDDEIMQVVDFYMPRIKRICNDDDYIQSAIETILNCINRFEMKL